MCRPMTESDILTALLEHKVMQTRFGPKAGNCFSACLATLLGIGIDEVPEEDLTWMEGIPSFEQVNAWVRPMGLAYFEVLWDDRSFVPLDGVLGIAIGPGPRGCNHAVVVQVRKDEITCYLHFLHDPHPSGKYLISVDQIGFFLARHPWRCRDTAPPERTSPEGSE